MKRIILYLYLFAVTCMVISCSHDENQEVPEYVKIDGFMVGIGERATAEPSTRATSDFAVNKSIDPTFDNTRLTGTGGWELNVNILNKNNQQTEDGSAQCAYTGGVWIPQKDLYFPSYHSPQVQARLAPPGWTDIALDQSSNTNFLLQDILVEASSPYTIRPSHTPEITLRHAHTMLDFILQGVDFSQIASVEVTAGGNTYNPYRVQGTSNIEYMVILPVNTSNPVVHITTTGGARYQETINISPMLRNNCYCAKLTGVELILSSVTVIDWVYGTALEGQYTTITTYPTFRGNAGVSVTLYYDNGLEQTFTFNANGENTIKPVGRTIIRVNDTTLPDPMVLDAMYIDLRGYL